MSNQSSSEKTEQPTPKRLRDLRKKGQVPMCKEIVSTALIVAMLGYHYFAWDLTIGRITELATAPGQLYGMPFAAALKTMVDVLIVQFILIVAPLVLIVLSVTFLANVLQNGIVFSAEPLKPQFSKIHPAEGFKKIFSANNFVEFVKSILKVTIVSGCVYAVMARHLGSMLNALACDLSCLTSALGAMLLELIVYACAAFIVVAAADLLYQRHSFVKKNMMTKDEVKRDHKESEGDPIIKGRRRQLQRQIAESEQLEPVKRASVIIRNPTHFAVAVRYEPKDSPLPYVLAKGENRVAREIVRIAEENGIPVMENVPLARGLFDNVPKNTSIPADFIPAVVEVLHWVKRHHPEFRHTE